MNEQEKQSVRAVLEAALHNTKVAQDQLDSLMNPKDKSFKDFPVQSIVDEFQVVIDDIEAKLKEL